MPEKKWDRRQFLKSSGLAAVTPAAAPHLARYGAQPDNPTTAENRKPGTIEWQLQYTQFDDPVTMASYPLIRRLRSTAIEGFVSRTSYYPGDSVEFKVSLDPPGSFRIDLYRMGYYGGTGGRHFAQLGPFQAAPQEIPLMTTERLRECRWETAARFTIPAEWPGGVYVGKLSRMESFGSQSYVIFVVKSRRPAELLCQVSDFTWQAYNKWPGRDSIYDDGTTNVWYQGPNVRVSFDRPYAKYCQILDAPLSAGSGEYLLWEHPMTFWLEQEGYDVAYCSNADLHLDPGVLERAKVFISVGHDEYWSRPMFDNALKARDNGLSFAFFSGNSLYHQILLYDSGVSGDPCRAFAREYLFPDEEKLMGSTSYGTGYGDWVVTRPDHWIYEGTGLGRGDRLPALIGWEYHGPPHAPIDNLEVVAEMDLTPPGGREEKRHSALVYPGPKGNWVFNAGTIWWAEGLAQPPGHMPARSNRFGTLGVMPKVQRITRNILGRMLQGSRL